MGSGEDTPGDNSMHYGIAVEVVVLAAARCQDRPPLLVSHNRHCQHCPYLTGRRRPGGGCCCLAASTLRLNLMTNAITTTTMMTTMITVMLALLGQTELCVMLALQNELFVLVFIL